MNNQVEIRPVSLHDLPVIHEAAAADNHGVAAPSHVVIKNGEIVGYISMCVVPTVLLWLHSKKCRAADLLAVKDYTNDFMTLNNQPGYLVPIPADSPILPFAKKLGLQLASPNTMIYFKSLSSELTATSHEPEGK